MTEHLDSFDVDANGLLAWDVGILPSMHSVIVPRLEELTGFGLLIIVGSFVLAGVLLGFFWPRRADVISLFIGGAYLVVSVMQMWFDAAAHNLFPFEILISFALSVAPAYIGSYWGTRLRRHLS